MADAPTTAKPPASAAIWDPLRPTRHDPHHRLAAPEWQRWMWQRWVPACVGGLAAAALLARGQRALAVVAVSLALVGPVLSLISAALYDRWHSGWRALGRAVGRGLSWLTLAPIYLLIFWPFGLLTRRGQQDPLRRQPLAPGDSYWQERSPAAPDCEHPY